MKRLTKRRPDNGLAYLAKVKESEQDVESPYPNTLKAILECFDRLAAYEETELTPEEIIDLKADAKAIQIAGLEIMQERDTLEKALELACKDASDTNCPMTVGLDIENPVEICDDGCQGECSANCWHQWYMRQAQEGQK